MHKYFYKEFNLLIFRLSIYSLGRKKFSIRFSIEWGWDN